MKFDSVPTTRLTAEFVCAGALLLAVIWNIANVDHPATRQLRIPLLTQLVHQTAIYQEFQMFGEPPKVNPWFVYEARLVDGVAVDIFRDEPLDLKRPVSGLEKMPQFHWRRLHRSAVHSRCEVVRQPMLDFAVKRWNREHEAKQQVVTAKLIYFKEKTGPEFNELNYSSQVWGSFSDETKAAGSLFDSIKDTDLPF